ncbi:MAG: hypothetical protein EOP04_33620 [Proteobacteria bacterium]|nr:MAG: hypothetical protein EOP04_33620 [Pseudomonadota bacterium]
MTALGLDYSLYVTKEKLVDERLLLSRNNIAHGSYLSLDAEDYLEMHGQIIGMMEAFRNQIDNHATLGRFKRSTGSTVHASAQ